MGFRSTRNRMRLIQLHKYTYIFIHHQHGSTVDIRRLNKIYNLYASILTGLRYFINNLLTYLLTYLYRDCDDDSPFVGCLILWTITFIVHWLFLSDQRIFVDS